MANEGCSVEPEQLPLDHHIDFLMRFETLNRDFHRLCLALDIPSSPLPRRNRSERKHYSHYYDDELKEMVSKKYRDEIEFGQYEFEAVQHQTN